MTDQHDFISWISDPARTSDELFTVELLLEQISLRPDWKFRERAGSFDEKMERHRARGANPGYRPALPREEIEELGRQAAVVTHFQGSGMSDRPVRDLAALRFFPGLEQVSITSGEVRDLTPLAGLLKLQWLTIIEGIGPGAQYPLDFGQCGAKPALERLSLSLRHPWPDVRACGQWPVREVRLMTLNVLAAAEVAEFPEAELLELNGQTDTGAVLRDLRTFPAAPKIKRMRLYRTASLEGIERYPTLLNLEIGGPFTDLEPLTRLTSLTALTLAGEHFMDLTPLTRMPKLRELHLMRERPIDLAPLTEAAELRRVRYSRCAIMRTEVGALNAGLLPELHDFEAAEPRTLGPLKFYQLSPGNKAGQKFFNERDGSARTVREKFYAGDEALMEAEGRSFRQHLHGKLNDLLGRGWGLVPVSETMNTAGYLQLGFKRYQDTERIREILQLLREESARARFPWVYLIMVEPHGDMTYELEQLQELAEQAKEPEGYWLRKYFEPETALEENAEQLRHHQERYDYLEREHLHRLQEQQGLTVDPALADALDEDEAEQAEIEELEEELLSEPTSDDEGEGGVALAPPPPAPPDTESLSDQLQYAVRLYEDCVVVNGGWAERARYNLGEAPVEWTEELATN